MPLPSPTPVVRWTSDFAGAADTPLLSYQPADGYNPGGSATAPLWIQTTSTFTRINLKLTGAGRLTYGSDGTGGTQNDRGTFIWPVALPNTAAYEVEIVLVAAGGWSPSRDGFVYVPLLRAADGTGSSPVFGITTNSTGLQLLLLNPSATNTHFYNTAANDPFVLSGGSLAVKVRVEKNGGGTAWVFTVFLRGVQVAQWTAADLYPGQVSASGGPPGLFYQRGTRSVGGGFVADLAVDSYVAKALDAPATAVVVDGPATGPVNAASEAFTAYLSPVDGTVAGDVVVTPSMAGLAGTWSPSSVTLNQGAGGANQSKTFRFTPAAIGSGTATFALSGAGAAGLTPPAGQPFTSALQMVGGTFVSSGATAFSAQFTAGRPVNSTLVNGLPAAVVYQLQRAPDESGVPGVYANTGNPVSSQVSATTLSGGGLTPATSYWFRCRQQDIGGQVAFTAGVRVTTLSGGAVTDNFEARDGLDQPLLIAAKGLAGGVKATRVYPQVNDLDVSAANPMPVGGTVTAKPPAALTATSHTAASASAGLAATITLAATPGVVHTLSDVAWSFSEAPTAGRVRITSNGVTVFDADVTQAGPGQFVFPTRKGGTAVGHAVVVTADPGGGTALAKVNVTYTAELG